jgi:carotenoid 1,2-hydratase
VRDLRTVEDTPFYARSLLTDGASSPAHVVHESLSLERFRSPWVQSMLPFRMPRRRSRPRK